MKVIPQSLQDLLNTGMFQKCDLIQFTLADGTGLYYTSYDIPVLYNGQKYLCGGANLKRGKLSFKNDLSVNTLDITINSQLTGYIEGVPIMAAIKNGILDGATMTLYRAFFPFSNLPLMVLTSVLQNITTDSDSAITTDSGIGLTASIPLGPANVVMLFTGRVADVAVDRTKAQITVNSWLEILDTQLPQQLYGAPCIHNLYDGPDANGNGCKINIASYTTQTVITGAPTTSMFPTILTVADDLYQYGIAEFTSGMNSGLQRTITAWKSNIAFLDEPTPTAPSPGDTVTLIYGCDKTLATCLNRFNNLANYFGFPYIPPEEAAV